MTPIIKVGLDQLHKEYAETVNMELFKRYNNQKVSQNIVNKLRKVRPKLHEEIEAPNLPMENFPQNTKIPPERTEKFKRPYDVSKKEPTLKKSVSKMTKQLQNDLWHQINHDRQLGMESKQMSNTLKSQQNNIPHQVQQIGEPQGLQQGI